MTELTDAEAQACADIMIVLARLDAYGGALPWKVGERHDDDEPQLLSDEIAGYLLSLPQQADKEREPYATR
jgi:hypothetical protein